MFSLAQLNGIVSYQSWRLFGVEPRVYMPNRIRTYFGVAKAGGGKDGATVKQNVLSLVNTLYPDAVVRTRASGHVHSATFDQADAVLVGLFALCAHHTAAVLREDDFVRACLDTCVSVREPASELPADVVPAARALAVDAAVSGEVPACTDAVLKWAVTKMVGSVQVAVREVLAKMNPL